MTKEQRRKHILCIAEMIADLLDSLDDDRSKTALAKSNDTQTSPPIGPPQKVLIEEEFCRVVGISPRTAWRERKAGRLPYLRVAGKIKYLPRHIDEYLNNLNRPIQSKRK